ncbi:MBL fold metallo-hydrolase [Candidatus Nitrospira bockiana]
MPEPKGTATCRGEVAPRVYHWTMQDDRINFQSDSYAVVEAGHVILIDPLPLAAADLGALGRVQAICLTTSRHERAAWRYRRQLRVPVYGPSGGTDFEEPPDAWYNEGDHLPGNLIAVPAAGPATPHYAFYLERDGGILFCGDLLVNPGDAGLALLPDAFQDSPEASRGSARHLLSFRFETLCPNHGDPIRTAARERLRSLLGEPTTRVPE